MPNIYLIRNRMEKERILECLLFLILIRVVLLVDQKMKYATDK